MRTENCNLLPFSLNLLPFSVHLSVENAEIMENCPGKNDDVSIDNAEMMENCP